MRARKINKKRQQSPRLQEVFCEKGILRNFAKFTEKQLCQSLFLINFKKETNTSIFLVNFVRNF